jgi:hypothetical protein
MLTLSNTTGTISISNGFLAASFSIDFIGTGGGGCSVIGIGGTSGYNGGGGATGSTYGGNGGFPGGGGGIGAAGIAGGKGLVIVEW